MACVDSVEEWRFLGGCACGGSEMVGNVMASDCFSAPGEKMVWARGLLPCGGVYCTGPGNSGALSACQCASGSSWTVCPDP